MKEVHTMCDSLQRVLRTTDDGKPCANRYPDESSPQSDFSLTICFDTILLSAPIRHASCPFPRGSPNDNSV